MKLHLFSFLVVFTFSTSLLHAQYGLNITYQTFSAGDWETLVLDSDIPQAEAIATGFGVGIDRWFRLKNTRIEFFPELNYSRYNKNWSGDAGGLELQRISLFANTHFYLLDMAGDCDCPTFSKDGGVFKKGFFVRLSPGISYNRMESTVAVISDTRNVSGISPSLGIGIGLDIGVNDFVTVTPFVDYRYMFGTEWKNLNAALIPTSSVVNADINTSNVETVHFGLRIGLRFDERRR